MSAEPESPTYTFELKHKIEGQPADAFELTLIPFQCHEVKVTSGAAAAAMTLPALTPRDSEVVNQVSVQRVTGGYVANGAIYTNWSWSEHPLLPLPHLGYRKTESWPPNMSFELVEGSNHLIFTLDKELAW
ncbi:hypothetical protein OHA19_44310 (plasmid) [Streptomyces sp. NBC_00012]|uniref:hypothetical protein n=1 Tax=Streptomyces sp. NBC_00012 TaxID=2975621 RepID=UPI002F9115DE